MNCLYNKEKQSTRCNNRQLIKIPNHKLYSTV